MATESYVQVAPNSTGAQVDGFTLASNSQFRQAVVLGDALTGGNTVAIGADGMVPVKNPSVFYSSTANLAVGATYLTPWIDTGAANGGALGVSFTVTADQPIQYVMLDSPDNGTTSRQIDLDVVPANTTYSETQVAYSQYIQFTFTNIGGAATTSTFINVSQRASLPPEAQRITDKWGNDALITNNSLQVSDGGSSFTVDTGIPGKFSEYNLSNAQASDNPIFVALTGDPAGDFAGVNLLEQAMNAGGDMGLNVRIQNPNLADARGASIESDIPSNVTGSSGAVGPVIVLDTTGYDTVAVALQGTWAGTVTFQSSIDGGTWYSVAGWPSAGAAAPVTTTTANGLWSFPLFGRWFRAAVTAYTSGTVLGVAQLRSSTLGYTSASTPTVSAAISGTASVNTAQIAGTVTVNAGLAGVQAVGGNVAPGAAPTTNPLNVGGADPGGLTRRMATDTTGAVLVGGSAAISPTPVVVAHAPSNSSLPFGETELLDQILIQLRIIGLYLRELPNQIASTTLTTTYYPPPQMDDETVLRDDPWMRS